MCQSIVQLGQPVTRRLIYSPRRFLFLAAVMVTAIGCSGSREESAVSAANGAWTPLLIASADTSDLGVPFLAAALPNGQFAFATASSSGLVEVIDSTGAVIRQFGGVGEGPGEYRGVLWLLGHGDSLVVGTGQGKTLVFSTDGAYLGEVRLQLRPSGYRAHLRGDTLVVAEPIYTKDRFGYPLHVMTLSGDTLRSFGVADRSFDAASVKGDAARLFRSVAPATDSTFWAVAPFTYRIEEWSAAGVLIREAQAERAWLLPGAGEMSSAQLIGGVLPAPRVRGIQRSSGGKLLALTERPRSAESDPAPQHLGSTGFSGRLTELVQEIELVDPSTGTLLWSIINPGPAYLMGFLGPDLLWGITTDPDGREQPVVYRLPTRAE